MKSAEIEQLLPEVFQRTLGVASPLRSAIGAMEALHAPSESLLAELDRYFDTERTPAALLPFLATWVDLDRVFSRFEQDGLSSAAASGRPGIAEPQLRRLIAAAAQLAQWRGTERGLIRFLEVATGKLGFSVRDAAHAGVSDDSEFVIWIEIPPGAREDEALIRRIVAQEKPAHLSVELMEAPPAPGTETERPGGAP